MTRKLVTSSTLIIIIINNNNNNNASTLSNVTAGDSAVGETNDLITQGKLFCPRDNIETVASHGHRAVDTYLR